MDHDPEALAQLDRLWQRGREFLGTRTAIMAGAMTWVSERHLVSAMSNAFVRPPRALPSAPRGSLVTGRASKDTN